MGPTSRRELAGAVAVVTVISYLVLHVLYRYFLRSRCGPGCRSWRWQSPRRWALSVRARIRDGEIGVGAGRLNPLVVARGVAIAKASAWVGALALGWWLGVLAYLLPKRSELRVATADTPGAVVAALSAFALIVAALWLQYCCRSPNDPNADRSRGRNSPAVAALAQRVWFASGRWPHRRRYSQPHDPSEPRRP